MYHNTEWYCGYIEVICVPRPDDYVKKEEYNIIIICCLIWISSTSFYFSLALIQCSGGIIILVSVELAFNQYIGF